MLKKVINKNSNTQAYDEYTGNADTGIVTNSALTSYEEFFYQEAFRNLFTSIRFLSSDKPLKTVILTSSLPAEGKSLINVLLAKTLSEMGQRVLLVDADMRKPQIHHRLGLNNLTGLSNLLTEPSLRSDDAIQLMKGYTNWSVLTAGTSPPDPTRLLSSKSMHKLVQEFKDSNQYDLVIFDTPPVLGLADAPLLAQYVDGLILVVSIEKVDRDLPKEAISRIRSSSGAQLLGVLTNSITEATGLKSAKTYGAYAPHIAYSYYKQDESEITGKSSGDDSNWRKKASKLQRRILNWIDN